ncbi:outer membrane beta-barrel protein, partial [Bacteroidota bacterium]
EFFGGDPSMVLKNLPADAIAKIEVIDKKSDESELTGVEDGNKRVVINFSLKKNKKKRGFGKIATGIGLENRYFTNLNYNKFDAKTQFSAIGKFNNINVTGSSIQSFLNNSDGLADESDDNDSPTRVKNLSGYLQTELAALHYGHEFQKRESFNTDYSYSASENYGASSAKRTTYNPKSAFNSTNEKQYHNTNKSQQLNFNYKNQSKKTSSLFIKGGYSNTNSNYLLKRNDSIFNTLKEVRTYTFSDSKLERIQNSADIKATYYKKLDSLGKSFNLGISNNLSKQNTVNNQDTERLYNYNTDYPILRLTKVERDDETLNNNLRLSVKYTQPLYNDYYFKVEGVVNIKTSRENINQNKTETENSIENKFPLIFDQDFNEHRYSTNLLHTYNTKTVNYFSGVELLELDRNFGLAEEIKFNKSQFYVNPKIWIQLTPKRGKKYNFSYNKNITSPKNSQITAVINDVNPNYIRKGNPDLKTEKSNNFSFRSVINNFKSSLIFVTKLSYKHTDDAIIQTIETDEEFEYIRTRNYTNKGTKESGSAFISVSKKINKIGLRTNLKLRGGYNNYNALVNRKNNDVFSHNYKVDLSIENFDKNIFDVKIGASYSLNNTKFSLDENETPDTKTETLNLNRKFIKQHYFAMIDTKVSKRLNINSQLDYNLLSDNQFISNQKIPLWNAAISYALTNNKRSIAKLVLIDLLNKNVDITRRSSLNYFEETTNQSLGRYIVLSYTYRLNGGNKKKSNKKKRLKNS